MNNELKVYRAKQDLTQEKLAKEVGVTRQTINAIETGRYDPSLSLAFELAEYFNCSVGDLFIHD
ncbi:helix-turn-helix transcriptional regulator (plasmid) [Haloferax larsenii]|uniref:Helix-turn-helix transcriptional regulator n=1 Tax=Haloferax larsenii TaxID=302484 RepID=A0ABY5RLS9_HALLR|nr:helix-turn-helix transcriptional regulator [Haloferax larsenii]UVE51993.1 helix-turn-helix transcriptional regulator [Haloferax larsenii]